MKVTVTLYKDNVAVYTDGVKMEVDSESFAIRGAGYISTVDFFDLKPNLDFPHIMATELDLNDGRKWYVSETKEEIEAQIRTSGGSGTGNYEFLVQFVVGEPGAPANGETQYVNADVVGDIQIEKNGGPGYLTEGVEGDGTSEFALLPGGGFELINGYVFSTEEKYTIFKVNS